MLFAFSVEIFCYKLVLDKFNFQRSMLFWCKNLFIQFQTSEIFSIAFTYFIYFFARKSIFLELYSCIKFSISTIDIAEYTINRSSISNMKLLIYYPKKYVFFNQLKTVFLIDFLSNQLNESMHFNIVPFENGLLIPTIN